MSKEGISVKELIVELLEYNMDAEVVTTHSETVELGYIGENDCTDMSDKKTTPFVFIDGCDYVRDEDG